MKKEKISVAISIIFLELLLAANISFSKNEEYFIDSDSELYQMAIQFLYDKDDNPNKDKDNYKLFIDYNDFGVTKKQDYKYAYLWVVKQSYYVKNNKIVSDTGSSMPYKFRFNRYNSILDYEIPKDGNEYANSIKEMFPNTIEEEVLTYQIDDSEMLKEVKKYYSTLEDTKIYHPEEV